MNKDLIKYGLLALGAYLIYRYIEEQGGISNLFGSTTLAQTPVVPITAPATTPASTTTTAPPPAPPATVIPPAPLVLDMTGLVVTPDINDSLSGTVKINGVPVKLSIITGTGQIFDGTGADVTSALQGQGVDIVGLRTSFANAGAGLSGLGAAFRYTPAWLM